MNGPTFDRARRRPPARSADVRELRGPARPTLGEPLPDLMLRLGSDEVDVWRASLDDQPAGTAALMQSLISNDELERSRRFYFDRDRRRYVVGRGILRMLLARYLGCAPQEIAFRYGAQGKPALAAPSPAEPLHFNVAHSEGLALFAFTRAGEVGVDVEMMRDLPDWEDVAKSAFSAPELAALRACPAERRRDEFFRAWTRQEAVLKGLGTGLGGVASATSETAFTVYPVDVGPGYAAALATTPRARRSHRVNDWSNLSGLLALARSACGVAGEREMDRQNNFS